MGKRVSKADLPRKTCLVCRRPFAWRKKWAKDWDQVRYCSERCRRKGIERDDSSANAPAPHAD